MTTILQTVPERSPWSKVTKIVLEQLVLEQSSRMIALKVPEWAALKQVRLGTKVPL
jgi:hypothetical protein